MAGEGIIDNLTNKFTESLLGKTEIFDGLKNLNTDIITGKNKEILNIGNNLDDVDKKGADFLNTNTMFGNIGDLLGISFVYYLVKDVPVIGKLFKEKHTKSITEKVNGFDENIKGLTKSMYSQFNKNKQATIAEANSIRKITGLDTEFDDPEDADQIAIKAKIPEDYATMQKSIVDGLTDDNIKLLNINTVKLVSTDFIKTENGVEVVDTDKIKANLPVFAETYLKIIVPKLAKQDFIKSPSVDKDTFALAIFGNLTGEKFFVEGVNLGIVNKNDYLDTQITAPIIAPVVAPVISEGTEKETKYIETIASKFSSPQKEYIIKYGPTVFKEAKKYDETKNIVPTIFAQVEKESGRDINSHNTTGEDSIGLMQINKAVGHLEKSQKAGFDINIPEGNIGYGIYYLAECIKSKGNVYDGLDQYNGAGNFNEAVADRYSTAIKNNLNKYDIPEINLA